MALPIKPHYCKKQIGIHKRISELKLEHINKTQICRFQKGETLPLKRKNLITKNLIVRNRSGLIMKHKNLAFSEF